MSAGAVDNSLPVLVVPYLNLLPLIIPIGRFVDAFEIRDEKIDFAKAVDAIIISMNWYELLCRPVAACFPEFGKFERPPRRHTAMHDSPPRYKRSASHG